MTPTRLYGEPRRCPTGDGRAVRSGHLTCPPCWRRVPAPLKAAVNATWRAWERDPGPGQWDAYLTAREAALASLGGP